MLTITKPTLLLDTQTCKSNILGMLHKANKHNLRLRPHFKTHQSPEIGNWYKALGVTHITVSSLDMAEAFANHGWKHILVAVPVNVLEAARINQLAAQVDLSILIAQKESLEALVDSLIQPISFFIEIDTGYGRTGISPENLSAIEEIIGLSSEKAVFAGFYVHAGHSYQTRSKDALQSIHQGTLRSLRKLKSAFQAAFPRLRTVSGDTPTCSVMDNFEYLDEISPGNFVFYDYTQKQIGSCESEQVAVAVACPVIATKPQDNEAIIYGGAVHFSKDSWQEENGIKHYGPLLEWHGTNWGKPIAGCFLKSVSQEHGKVQLTRAMAEQVRVGDVLCFQPVHSCLTSNLHAHYLTTEGETITRI